MCASNVEIFRVIDETIPVVFRDDLKVIMEGDIDRIHHGAIRNDSNLFPKTGRSIFHYGYSDEWRGMKFLSKYSCITQTASIVDYLEFTPSQ